MTPDQYLDPNRSYKSCLVPMLRAAEELIAAGDEDPKTIAAKLGPIVEAPDADPLLFQFWIDDDGIQSHIRAKLSDFKLKQQQKEERERQQRSTEAAIDWVLASRCHYQTARTYEVSYLRAGAGISTRLVGMMPVLPPSALGSGL